MEALLLDFVDQDTSISPREQEQCQMVHILPIAIAFKDTFFSLPAFSRSSLLGKEEHNERPVVVMDGTVWMIGGDVKAGTAFFVATALSPRIIVTTSFLYSGFLQGVDKTAFVGPFETS